MHATRTHGILCVIYIRARTREQWETRVERKECWGLVDDGDVGGGGGDVDDDNDDDDAHYFSFCSDIFISARQNNAA